MPSHFHSICQARRVTERRDVVFERRRQAKRIGSRSVVSGLAGRDQSRKPVRGRLPFAHQARGDRRRRQIRRLRQGADDQCLRDAEAQLAGQEFEQDEALPPIEGEQPLGTRESAAWRDRVVSSGRIRSVTHAARLRSSAVPSTVDRPTPRTIHHQRCGLGAVADDRVALLDHPALETCGGQRPVANRGAGNQSLQPAAGEKEHRPGGIGSAGPTKYSAMASTLALVEVVRSSVRRASRSGSSGSFRSCFAFPRRAHDPALETASLCRNRASGSACPCVASTRDAPVSSMVCSSAGQSA